MKCLFKITIGTIFLVTLLMGCSVEQSHQILSIFFDGVPSLAQMRGEAPVDPRTGKPRLALAQLVKHDPYDSRECEECHNKTTKQLVKKVPELCYQCHGDDFLNEDREFQQPNVHSPFEDGDCTECHHPHEAPQKFMLKKPVGTLCFGCHDEEDFQGEATHTAVTDGLCAGCHNPHQSEHEKMLQKPLDELCFECHKPEDFQGELVHSPVEDGACAECHDPHKSDHEKQLRKPVGELCFTCHDKGDYKGEVVHSPFEDGECVECHNPHKANGQILLHKTVVETCLGCHTPDDLADEEGVHQENLGDLKKLADPAKAGLEDMNICIECHNPHVSDKEFLLKE